MTRVKRALAGAGVAAAVLIGAVLGWVAWPLPASVTARADGVALTVVDRNGLPLRATRSADGSQERWVPFDRIDPDAINAFVAVEDRRFWEHRGVDLRAVLRAARDNVDAGKVVSGSSTITMQLARLLRGTPRHWAGKAAQTMWALRLEAHLSKQDILEHYLNRLQLGQGAVGIGAASALYFDASASELSIGHAATLAGLAHAPSRDNPHASPTRARARQLLAVRRMRQLGYATADDVARAADEPLGVRPRAAPFVAAHFTTRVLAWMAAERSPEVRGQVVRTSLSLELQSAVEGEVRHAVEMLRARGVEHAAAVVLDNYSGEVLAWVGSPDFWAPKDGQTDMVVSPRQPGSALKPFLYGLAMDRGFTAASVLPDLPRSFATATGSYAPRNYDRRFRGPVRAREALASSYNVPAVELAARIGTGPLLHTLHLAGFASLDRGAEHYGLGLALGNGDVTLIELANGYRALASEGEWRDWTWRAASDGAAATGARGGETRRVVSPVASAIVLSMLSDAAARIPGFGLETPFDFPFPVAVKTGTSRHFTDNWAVAVTRGFTVAVWAGNFSGRPMQGVSGVTGAGPLLHRVVMETARRVEPGALTTPAEAGAVAVPVCRLSGMRATPACASLTEWFAPGTAPVATDDWERPDGVTLPEEYASWAGQQMQPAAEGVTLASVGYGTVEMRAGPPQGADDAAADVPREGRTAPLRITSPRDGDLYAIPAGVESRYASISLQTSGAGTGGVRWTVDGRPYAGSRWPLRVGPHVFRATTARGTEAEARIVVVP